MHSLRPFPLLICVFVCLRLPAQEGRFFDIAGLGGSPNSLAIAPYLPSEKYVWDNATYILEDIPDIFGCKSDSCRKAHFWGHGNRTQGTLTALPAGPTFLFHAPVTVSLTTETLVIPRIMNAANQVMDVPVSARLLPPGTHVWELEVSLPAGTWSCQMHSMADGILFQSDLIR